MKLETEFRLCLQRQRLNQLLDSSPDSLQPSYTSSTWVKLLSLPSRFSFDEALLLCQCADDRWLAWVPDYGELLLSTHQFCPIA